MSSIGTGYDLSTSTYSPDGKLFQLDYAAKAVDNSGTTIGIKCADGVVLATEKLVQSKLLVPHSNRRLASVDTHIGIGCSGLAADARHIVKRAREEAQNYRDTYKTAIPGKIIAERVGQYVQAYTLYSSVRPFGVSILVAVLDKSGPGLYMIEPSGVYFGYLGCATGKGKQVAKTELEKLKLGVLSCREAVVEAARMYVLDLLHRIHTVHDDAKDKDFELELSWVCTETGGRHQLVPQDIASEAERLAKASMQDEMDED